MVIYDKNQFRFNLIFLFILIVSIFLNVYYSTNFKMIDERLRQIEANQDLNFIQAAHNDINYSLTEHGFLVRDANDFSLFNGPSMQPAVFDQNIVIMKKYSGEPLNAGMIVRFRRENGDEVIHRVRADYGGRLYVQGDSIKDNDMDGEIIKKEQVTHIIIGILFT